MEILNSQNFDEKISTGTVIDKFFANWCGPCRLIQPKFVSWANEHSEVKCFEVDCDASPDIVARYSVKGIPAFGVFIDGVFQSLNTKVREFDSLIKKD